MKTVALSGSPRTATGKKDAKSLRRDGRVPAVLYGGKESFSFHVPEKELNKLVYTPDVYQVELDVEGKKIKGIIKDLQFHPVTDQVLHADFLELAQDKPVKVKLPVVVTGSSVGVRNGGKLALNFKKLTLKGLANSLPDNISVDITALEIGQSVRVSDINLPGLTIEETADAVVIAVKMARGAKVADEEEVAKK